MPDMYRSPAVEAYVDYGEVRGRIDESKKTRLTAMTPPAFAIPYVGTDSTEVRLMMPYARLANESFKASHGMYSDVLTKEDHYTAAAADGNMIPLNALNAGAVLSKGKELFTAMCQHCHGEKGDGNGPMVASGAYSGVPNYAERVALSDGQMFYSIYYGKGMMGAHRSLLNKKEIWTVIHYIRSLQSPDYGKFDANGTAAVADTTKQK
jgi:mono/diheme cytochrome c family protein